MKEQQVIAVNLDDAPEGIRDEIKALASNKVHSFGEFMNLSDEAKRYLQSKSHDTTATLTKMMEARYHDAAMLIEIAELGLEAMAMVTGEEKAKAINLELYNACAKFVRAYNTKGMQP